MKAPWTTAAVAAAAAAVYLIPGVCEVLSYQRASILCGEWWRLLGGHLAHASPAHFAWNAAVFVALGARVESRMGRAFPAFLAGCALAISGGLLAFLPGLEGYCGLSGLDTALFGWLVLSEARQAGLDRDARGLAVNGLWLAALAGKVVYESCCGRAVFAADPVLQPVPLAHLLGALAGFACSKARFRLL